MPMATSASIYLFFYKFVVVVEPSRIFVVALCKNNAIQCYFNILYLIDNIF